MYAPLTLAEDDFIMVIAVGGLAIGLVAVITTFIRNVHRTRAVEQTKREIAAYVAEGSMSPEDGERLIRAESVEQTKREIAAHVAEGSMTTEDAERLIRADQHQKA